MQREVSRPVIKRLIATRTSQTTMIMHSAGIREKGMSMLTGTVYVMSVRIPSDRRVSCYCVCEYSCVEVSISNTTMWIELNCNTNVSSMSMPPTVSGGSGMFMHSITYKLVGMVYKTYAITSSGTRS